MALNEVRVVYGYDVDQASVNQAIRANEAVQRSADQSEQSLEQVNAELNRELGIIEKLRKKELELLKARERSQDPDQIEAYNQEIRQTQNELGRLTNATENQDRKNKKLGEGFKRLGGIIAAALSVGAIVSFTKGAVELAAEFEQLEISLAQFTGSGQAARNLLGEIEAFAASTPFQFPELAETARTLLAFGVSQDDVLEKLRQIGDIAAGSGNSVADLGAIFGKIITKGKAQTEELNQIAERGIPIYQILAEQFGVTTSEVGKLAETGELTADVIEEAFTKMTSAGGTFFGLTQKQSESTAGRLSTLRDNLEKIQRELGEKLLPIVNDVVGALTGFVQQIGFGTSAADALTDEIFRGSRALAEQQSELNVLVDLLKDTTLAEGTREEVLKRINALNPNVLEGLNLQNIEYDKLDDNLDAVNAELSEQIKLLRQKETIDFIAAKNAEARNKQIEAELFLGGLIRENFTDQELLSKSLSDQVEILTKRFNELGSGIGGVADIQTIFLQVAAERSEAIEQQKTLAEFQAQAEADLAGSITTTTEATEDSTEANEKQGKSIKDLKKELKALEEAYENAGSDDERSAISRQIKALKKLVDSYKIVTKETKKVKDELKKLNESIPDTEVTFGFQVDDISAATDETRAIIDAIEGVDNLEIPVDLSIAENQGDLFGRLQEFDERLKQAAQKRTEDAIAQSAEIATRLIGIASDVQEAVFNRRLEQLDEEQAAALARAGENAQARERIEAEFQAKREQLELQAARRRKAIALVEATIEGALAVIKTLANPFLAALTAAGVAANIALIASAQFKDGGFVPDGYTGDIHPDKAAGVVHGGEFVIDARTTKRLGLRGKSMKDFKREMVPLLMKEPDWSFNQITGGMTEHEMLSELKMLRKDLKRLPVNVTVFDEQGVSSFMASRSTYNFYLTNKAYG